MAFRIAPSSFLVITAFLIHAPSAFSQTVECLNCVGVAAGAYTDGSGVDPAISVGGTRVTAGQTIKASIGKTGDELTGTVSGEFSGVDFRKGLRTTLMLGGGAELTPDHGELSVSAGIKHFNANYLYQKGISAGFTGGAIHLLMDDLEATGAFWGISGNTILVSRRPNDTRNRLAITAGARLAMTSGLNAENFTQSEDGSFYSANASVTAPTALPVVGDLDVTVATKLDKHFINGVDSDGDEVTRKPGSATVTIGVSKSFSGILPK